MRKKKNVKYYNLVTLLIISLWGFGIGIISYLHYDMTSLRNIDYRFCFICFALYSLCPCY